MNERIKYIFDAASNAKVSMTDLALLTGISRETLYRWKDGKPAKDKLRLGIAYTIATRLVKACGLDELPLKNKLKKEPRVAVLRKIITEIAAK